MMNLLASEPTPRSDATTERLSGQAVRTSRRIWRIVWVGWLAVTALGAAALAIAADTQTAEGVGIGSLSILFWTALLLRPLLMRDAHTARDLARNGVASEGRVTSRWQPRQYRVGGVHVEWSEAGRDRTARFEISNPDLFVPANVTVLSRSDRWAALVLEDGRMLLGRQPLGSQPIRFRWT